MNNSATNDLGPIYMNARYYLPEVGRFVSPDTIVPEPGNPQTYNRYSYALNSPTNHTDPTGHCTSNYEAGSQELGTCLEAWTAVIHYLYGVTYGPGGNGQFPNETVSEWLVNADISTMESLMKAYGIDYGYTHPLLSSSSSSSRQSGRHNRIAHLSDGVCQYWQNCYEPALTMEEMRPDAVILPGFSVSGAGVWYGVGGEELILNIRSEEIDLYGYSGQGTGASVGADASIYFGVVWNLESNADYAGGSSALLVDYVPLIGAQAQLFWETGSIPFTGNTWGIAIGPSGGLAVGVSGAQTHYSHQLTFR